MFVKYKKICEKLNLSYKKDLSLTISVTSLLFILSIVSYFLWSYIISIFIFISCGFYLILHFTNLQSSFKQLTNAKEIAFNGFYRYVITLLKNNQILYGALQASLEYVDEVLVNDVNELIVDIETDVTINPFLKFMENFNDESIKQMIMLLYKTQETGIINEVLENINENMVYLQDNSIKNYIKKEEKKVERYYIFPIIFSAVVVILISFYVFTLLGEGIYV